jgi:hypothetical protein
VYERARAVHGVFFATPIVNLLQAPDVRSMEI